MDTTGALESIAGLLTSLPDVSVEEMLVTFDTLVNVSPSAQRPMAAKLLRNTASAAQDQARRDRLMKAADAVAAGEPAALTADGLTAQQAAEAANRAQPPDPAPEPPAEPQAQEESEEEDEDSPYMDEEPPKLPHLAVRHFFRGVVVRVGRDFADADGRAVCAGDLLNLLNCEPSGDGYTLSFLERTVGLSDREVIENTGNAWFQPVPTVGCLEELLEAIDVGLNEAEGDEETDLDDIETIREDVENCAEWISKFGQNGAAPRCRSGRLAAKVFGQDREMAVWIPFLFAAVVVCMPDLVSN